MKTFIGTKAVKSTAMTRKAYNDYRGWELPANENGDDAGYLVEYLDGGKPNHEAHEGYISWSPKDVFEQSYSEIKTRVTPADIEANIVSEHYFTAANGRSGALFAGTYAGREQPLEADADLNSLALLTFCVLILKNGFTVTGESACANPANFDADLGMKIARESAVSKVWSLMGYELKSKLALVKGN